MHDGTHIPLVSEHDSWISVDPIVGCPASCAYCYLGALDARATRPRQRADPGATMAILRNYLGSERTDDTPICLGNHTDMGMTPTNRRFALEFLARYATTGIQRTVCIVTKSALSPKFVQSVAATGVDVVFFLSQSFSADTDRNFEIGPIAKPVDTLRNAEVIAAYKQLRAVHFWRPFMTAFNPVELLPRRIAALSEAGFSCSVVTPLMLNPAIRRDPRIASHQFSADDYITDTEVIGQRPLRAAFTAGRDAAYAIYRNTACALALIGGHAERLRTSRSPAAATRCAPCSCPGRQREICTQAHAVPDERLIRRTIARELPSHHPNWRITSDAPRTLEIDDEIDEYTFNSLTHQIPISIVARSIQHKKAWVGTVARSKPGDEMPSRLRTPVTPVTPFDKNRSVRSAIERLRGITGFVTTLTTPEDRRAQAFSRYHHVERVAWLATLLCNQLSVTPDETMRIVWLHDLNRWPFAHNSERENYSQTDDMPSYFAGIDLELRPCELEHLRAFHEKNIDGLSRAAKIALLADVVTGIVEDPLLAVVGLNLSPHEIPHKIAHALSIPFNSPEFLESLRDTYLQFAVDRDPEWFSCRFSAIFQKCVLTLLGDYATKIHTESGLRSLFDLAFALKKDFLQPMVWPINNDRVCHGRWLRSDVIEPLLKSGSPIADQLLTLDEKEFVTRLVAEGAVHVDSADFLPDLDAVAMQCPEIAFVKDVPGLQPAMSGRR